MTFDSISYTFFRPEGKRKGQLLCPISHRTTEFEKGGNQRVTEEEKKKRKRRIDVFPLPYGVGKWGEKEEEKRKGGPTNVRHQPGCGYLGPGVTCSRGEETQSSRRERKKGEEGEPGTSTGWGEGGGRGGRGRLPFR